jgi:hypothetical protein
MKIEEYIHPELLLGRQYLAAESYRGLLVNSVTIFLRGVSKYEKDHFIIDLERDGRVSRGIVVSEMFFHERYLELIELQRSEDSKSKQRLQSIE